MKCIGRTGDVLIIDPAGRGFEGTTIQSWAIDSLVDHRLTAFTLNSVANSISSSVLTIIPPATEQTVSYFQTSFPTNLSCKWIITVLDQASGRVSACEVLGCYRGSTNDPSFTVYAKTGDPLKYALAVTTVGTQLQLNVINEETIPLMINWLRLSY